MSNSEWTYAVTAGWELAEIIDRIAIWAKEEGFVRDCRRIEVKRLIPFEYVEMLEHEHVLEITKYIAPPESRHKSVDELGWKAKPRNGGRRDGFYDYCSCNLETIDAIADNPAIVDRFIEAEGGRLTERELRHAGGLKWARRQIVIVGSETDPYGRSLLTEKGASLALFPPLLALEAAFDGREERPCLIECVLLPIEGYYYAASVSCLSFCHDEKMAQAISSELACERERCVIAPGESGAPEGSEPLGEPRDMCRVWEGFALESGADACIGNLPPRARKEELPNADDWLLWVPAIREYREWVYGRTPLFFSCNEKIDRAILKVVDAIRFGTDPVCISDLMLSIWVRPHFAIANETIARVSKMADRLLYPRDEDIEAGCFNCGNNYNLVLLEAIDRLDSVSGSAKVEAARSNFFRVLNMVCEQTGKEDYRVVSSHSDFLESGYLFHNTQIGSLK